MAWKAGKRGIVFQDSNGKIQERAYGEPVPEAASFPNLRQLIYHGYLEEVEEPLIVDLESLMERPMPRSRSKRK